MRIVVCVKQVPDVVEMEFDYERKVLVRDGVKNVMNPFDRRAIAEAVRIRSNSGGEVIAMTMGPPQAREALYECFVVGADRALHLVDQAFAGADTLATARALAAAARLIGFDLIICGKYSVDAETGQVGPEVAEILGIPHVTGVSKLDFDLKPGWITAERETDEGRQTVEVRLPALVTAAERLVRPVKVKEGDMEAVRDRQIEVVTAADLSDDLSSFGLSGSPTRVSEINSVTRRREVTMINGSMTESARRLADVLCRRGLFAGWKGSAIERPEPRAPVASPGKGRGIVVVSELSGDRIRGVSLELLGKANELASRLGGEVASVLIGRDVSGHAPELIAHGADRVLLIEGAEFADYNPLLFAAAVERTIEEVDPFAVLIPSTADGRDYAPRVAARLGLGLTADCVGLELDDRGELVQLKPAFGGQIVASILSNTTPRMATVRPGMLVKPAGDSSRVGKVERLEVSPAGDGYHVLSSSCDAGLASAELDDAEVVVCVGMGIGGPENLPVVEPLIRLLGAAVGATRRVVDRGWLPLQQQVGITGRAVAPKLYLGLGVRGSFNHTIGIQRSDIVVGVNTDPKAEIFQAADFGIVADVLEFVPELTAALSERRADSSTL